MSVKNFKYNASNQLSKNFNSREFKCTGKGHTHDTKIDLELIKKLQDFMNINEYNKALISSGYRCSARNKQIGGSSVSSHTSGRAVDIQFYKNNQSVNAKEVCCKAQDYGFKGLAYIDSKHVHLDNRLIGKYRGDERKGYSNNVPNGDFYSYFGIPKEVKFNLTRTLKKGCKGDDVRLLQTKLNSLGYDCGNADGDFGTKTDKAVKKFQKAKGLTQDGIVGKNSAHALGWLYQGK